MTTIGIILAGGKSSRMGRPKHALQLPPLNRSMLEVAIGAMQRLVDELVISSQSEILPGYRWIADKRPNHAGPLAALEAVMLAFADDSRVLQFIACPCDMPLLQSGILKSLLDVVTDQPIVALRFQDEDHPRPLPMRMTQDCLPHIVSLLNDGDDRSKKSLRALMQRSDVYELPAPQCWQELLVNINTPHEWETLRNHS